MKKYLPVLLGIINLCFAQDTITLRTGEEIKSKVLEIGIEEVIYRLPESTDTTGIILKKTDIHTIKYKGGRVDIFNQTIQADSELGRSDIITLKSGKEIKSKVLEINIHDIRYRNLAGTDTTILKLGKADIYTIKYKGGRVDTFNESIQPENKIKQPDSAPCACDVITLKTGDQIKAKVFMIGIKDIEYKKINDPDSSLQFLKKSEVSRIKYKGGRTDYFDEPAEDKTAEYTFEQGMKDAETRYPARNTGAGAVTTITILGGILGLIPAGICSASPPKIHNLGITDQNLLRNESYMYGYRIQAHKMKKKKIWQGFGTGCGILVGLILATAIL